MYLARTVSVLLGHRGYDSIVDVLFRLQVLLNLI